MRGSLRGQEYLVLIQLRSGPWQTTDLAELFNMKETNVSRELQRLRKKGFVESRQENPDDLRERKHYITDAGRDHLKKAFYDESHDPKTNRSGQEGIPQTGERVPKAVPGFKVDETGQMQF